MNYYCVAEETYRMSSGEEDASYSSTASTTFPVNVAVTGEREWLKRRQKNTLK